MKSLNSDLKPGSYFGSEEDVQIGGHHVYACPYSIGSKHIGGAARCEQCQYHLTFRTGQAENEEAQEFCRCEWYLLLNKSLIPRGESRPIDKEVISSVTKTVGAHLVCVWTHDARKFAAVSAKGGA